MASDELLSSSSHEKEILSYESVFSNTESTGSELLVVLPLGDLEVDNPAILRFVLDERDG